MPNPHETSIASLEEVSDQELKTLAKRFIANCDLARAERRTRLTPTPAAIEQYLQEPLIEIEMIDPLVARTLAEAIFARYIQRLKATQRPDPPQKIPETSGVPES